MPGPDEAISQLPAASTLTGSEIMPLVQAAADVSVTLSTLRSFIGGGPPSGAAGGVLAGTYPNPAAMSAAGITNVLSQQNIINVKDATYGAKGDGITDDTAAIQAALNAAAALSVSGMTGGTVVLPFGMYMVSNTITVPSRVTMRGAGRRSTGIGALAGFPGSAAFATVSAASDGQNLNALTGGNLYLSTLPAATSGWVRVNVSGGFHCLINYTNTSAAGGNHLTGCTAYWFPEAGGTATTGQNIYLMTPVVRLGRAGTDTDNTTYDMWLQDLSVWCNSLAQVGVYMETGQEGCGIRNVLTDGELSRGFWGNGQGMNGIVLSDVEFGSPVDSVGCDINVAGMTNINRITTGGNYSGGGTSVPAGSPACFISYNGTMNGTDWHLENGVDGIHFGPFVGGHIDGIDASDGGTNVTNLIHWPAGAKTYCHLTGIQKNGATHTILVTDTSVTMDDVVIPDAHGINMSQTNDRANQFTITPSGSPFSYQNTTPFMVCVIVQGGTVSAVAMNRNAGYVTTGATQGPFLVGSGDRIQVTYSSAPTMTGMPF